MTTTAYDDQYTVATEPHIRRETVEDALRGQIAALELELRRQRERAELAESELKKAQEQEPVGYQYQKPGDEAWLMGDDLMIPRLRVAGAKFRSIYAAPKPAASVVDDATAQRIALAVYDYQNRISDEPLMHAINRILIKEAHPLSADGLAEVQSAPQSSTSGGQLPLRSVR